MIDALEPRIPKDNGYFSRLVNEEAGCEIITSTLVGLTSGLFPSIQKGEELLVPPVPLKLQL